MALSTGMMRLTNFVVQSSKVSSVSRFYVLVLICLISSAASQFFDSSQCGEPLGMESGDILDVDLTASSSFEVGNVGPQNGRVRVERQGGAWCPKNQITADAKEWLQIDLHGVHVITGTETQGRFGNGQGREFAEAYVLSYWRPALHKWVRYRDHTGDEILKGNVNTYLASKTDLSPPIIGSKLRILPYSYHRRTVCMRVEIYGCPFRGGLVSYTMPQGSKRGENWSFYDHTYDGLWEGSYLRNGLGQLTDGRVGPTNFKDDYYGHERGQGWVGWKNDSKIGTNKPVEIIFKFDSFREFNAVYIHSSNQFSRDVQVFSQAVVDFSVGGKIYPGDPISYIPQEDRIFEDTKNISIKLHHRVGKYVKIQLYWAAKWILISEVTFDSRPIVGNFSDDEALLALEKIAHQSDDSKSSSVKEGFKGSINDGNTDITKNNDMRKDPSHTIIFTAIVSSFIAVAIVLLIICLAMISRHELKSRRKSPVLGSNSSSGGPPFDNHSEYGVGCISPDEIRKCKIVESAQQEYQEPFVEPHFTTFGDFKNISNAAASTVNAKQDNSRHYSQQDKSKMAEYYSCTLVSNSMPQNLNGDSSNNEYEYAVPNELGKLLPNQMSPLKSIPSSPAIGLKNRVNKGKQIRFRELGVYEIPKHRMRMLRKLGEGAFGVVYVGEVDGVGNIGGIKSDKTLVAVKHLLPNATEKDKSDFIEEVRILNSLKDPNVAQVLGVCTEEEPYSVVLEFLELGDLCQFLRNNDSLLPGPNKKLSFGSLLYLASQVASGMKFLESRNIVHRDLAARNCVVGKGLVVKISHFATDTDLYSADYFKLDGKMPLPIRWMAWESLFMGKYSTKSDVWSFGVTLWEIMSFARHSPYPTMSNDEVLQNLQKLSVFNSSPPFESLGRPQSCPRDIHQLMCDTWRRSDEERPSFWEIHSFLNRKNLNFVPPPPPLPNSQPPSTLPSASYSSNHPFIV